MTELCTVFQKGCFFSQLLHVACLLLFFSFSLSHTRFLTSIPCSLSLCVLPPQPFWASPIPVPLPCNAASPINPASSPLASQPVSLFSCSSPVSVLWFCLEWWLADLVWFLFNENTRGHCLSFVTPLFRLAGFSACVFLYVCVLSC